MKNSHINILIKEGCRKNCLKSGLLLNEGGREGGGGGLLKECILTCHLQQTKYQFGFPSGEGEMDGWQRGLKMTNRIGGDLEITPGLFHSTNSTTVLSKGKFSSHLSLSCLTPSLVCPFNV